MILVVNYQQGLRKMSFILNQILSLILACCLQWLMKDLLLMLKRHARMVLALLSLLKSILQFPPTGGDLNPNTENQIEEPLGDALPLRCL